MSRARNVANLGADTTNLEDISSAYSAGALSNRNKIINGAMVIDQRNGGASVTLNDEVFPVDRFRGHITQLSKLTAQRSTAVPAGFNNSLLITSSSAYSVSSGDFFNIAQAIEGFNVADLGWGTAAAQSVTVSFWVRSSLTGTFGGAVRNSAGNRSYPFTYTISAADTWEYKTVTIAGDTSGTWATDNGTGIRLTFSLGAGSTFSGTAGAWAGSSFWSATDAVSVVATSGATWQITGVQLEVGSTATPFEHRSYGQELALCQRYYQRTVAESGYATFISGVICSGATSANGAFQLMYPMRATPTFESSAAATFALSDGATGTAASAISLAGVQSNSRMAAINIGTAGGLTQYRPYRLEANNSTTAYLGFSAEL